jgi:GDP/UDP-N,N'-diacetylbacillosamine 2-epimerase (hydrolysing)
LPEEEIRRQIGIPTGQKYAVVTFHPVTLEKETAQEQAEALLAAMKREHGYFYLMTKANADAGGAIVNDLLEKFARENEQALLVASLGMVRYLSAVKYCAFVLGNSSSGVIEAPALGVPTVNIGDRQQGRLMAETVIRCGSRTEEIVAAIEQAANTKHQVSDLYGTGHTAERIVEIIKQFLFGKKIDLKKKFYDMEQI